MDQLVASLENLLKLENEDPSNFYTYLSNCVVSEQDEKYFMEEFIPKVYYLYEKKVLRKDIVYLSLLASENDHVLQKFLVYDRSVFVLNVDDATSFFDYCVYERKHWVFEVIKNPSGFDKIIQLPEIYNKFRMIKYVWETNSQQLDIEYLHSLSTQINVERLDEFWKLYLEEVTRFIDVVRFCKQFLKREVSDIELFTFASKNSLLDTLSNYTDLSDSSHWEAIKQELHSSSDSNELYIFSSFVIIGTLIRLLIHHRKDSSNSVFENVKTWLLEIQNKQLTIELLETIFQLLFHKTENDFTCQEKDTRFILVLLKSVIEILLMKKTYEKNSDQYKKIILLSNQVTDFFWRLDLIINTKMTPKIEQHLLNYMLAPPESLIHICLKCRNFERAHQVIEIFNLRDSDIAREVTYAESFLKFRKFLRKNGKLKVGIDKTVDEFFQSNQPPTGRITEDAVDRLSQKFDYMTHFKSDSEEFLNVFDFAFTGTKTWEESELMLTLTEKKFNLDENISSDLLNFYKKVTALAFEVGPKDDVPLSEILTNPKYPLDLQKYKTKETFYDQLEKLDEEFQNQTESSVPGTFNKNHPSHKTLLKINELCHNYAQELGGKEPRQYLYRLFNYLKAFSRVLYIEQNSSDIISKGKNTSYFHILNFNRSELTGKLLFERHLDPTEFEKYFGKLKLDFLYHVVGNCFPTINLHVQENVTIEELYHDNMLYVPSPSIIVYIQKRNWLLAFILSQMYKVEGVKIDISEARLRTFFNYLKMPKVQHLKALFENNDIIAALQNCINAHQVKLYFREQIVEHDLVSIQSQTSNNSEILETGEEILEDTKTTNWKRLHDIVESIPENQLKKKTDLVTTKNNVLVNLVHDGFEPEYYKYASFISNRDLRINTILSNFKKWPGAAACDVIKLEITRFDCLRDSKMEALEEWLHHIELNEELKRVFNLRTWYKSYNFCKNDTERALDKILVTDQVDLLLDFIKLYKPSEDILSNITSTYVFNILDVNIPLLKIKVLLDLLPFDHAIGICHNLLTILRNLEHLQFAAEYLANNASEDPFLKNARVSLKMLTVFPLPEQEQLFCLIGEPLSIIEVLLINTKLDKLAAILELLNIKNCHDFDEVINVEKVDRILRTYAEKSLDFRVITNPTPRLRTPESKLLQSLDSLSLASDKKPFVVPENVPPKEEWVQNDEVIECMCCRQVVFSMFNRRHHCRRCGRVVCYGCSLKRMLVPTYGDILVRVCSDCYHQTSSEKSDGFSDIPSSRSFSQEYWLLNDDPEHNKITREEFSYEHAPSTSLCFSILRYHSKSAEYPRFLLEQCEVMLKLLQPSEEPTHEIDYLLVVKMLKSLATAAKIGSLENMQDSGASMADRILSQAELLALLAERGCLNLMPLVGAQNLYVDATVLRRLRDKLLQREQWNLALEVSTKAGLDNTGVFAAWGKSCLKAGSLLVAREKFQRCLDKNSQYETLSAISRQSDLYRSLDSLSLGRSRFSSRISTSSTLSTENKPSKDPPLLNEIIHILETKTRSIRPEVLEKMQRVTISGSMTSLNQLAPFSVHTDTAISVVNRIKNLKQLTSRNFSLSEVTKIDPHASRPPLDPIFFDECIYYLKRYGTHLSLLEFLLRHGEIHTALLFILENQLTPDLFIEVYMKCLKEGRITFLQEQISLIDSSLNLWKDYLKQLCRHLEKQQLLNCLYQLQLYIGDYVRASMTCIRFYEENVTSFSELVNNVGHLYKGEEHLKQVLEQDQWVEVASVGESSNTSKDSFEERMLSNPELVMKIETKDVNRHIITVKRQIEVVNFLSQCESSGVDARHFLKQLTTSKGTKIPTLFGSTSDKINLAVMLILCGATVEEGFNLAIKIIEDFKLRPIKVYCLAGKQFAKSERYNGISQLVNCIKSTGVNDSAISDMLDEMLMQTVGTLIKENVTGTKVEDLIKLIKDKGTKISAYIEAKQLKTAYFLAVKYKRTADIRRIQSEAELLNMPTIKALCQKVLQSSQSHSKDS